jgi:hypothetical protein
MRNMPRKKQTSHAQGLMVFVWPVCVCVGGYISLSRARLLEYYDTAGQNQLKNY